MGTVRRNLRYVVTNWEVTVRHFLTLVFLLLAPPSLDAILIPTQIQVPGAISRTLHKSGLHCRGFTTFGAFPKGPC